MKIFQIHNNYKYFGGEDSVVEEEAKLLKSKKHKVYQIFRNNNEELNTFSKKLIAFKNITYSDKSIKILEKKINKFGVPDIAHIHNFFPLWSYSIFKFLNEKKIPIILTLHNYRLIYDKINFLNDEIRNFGLYKNSLLYTFLISKLLTINKKYLKFVDKFITHTEFTKKIFIKYGIPKNKIFINPNFIHKSNNLKKKIENKTNALYASRVSKEKGILTLLDAWRNLDLKLDIVGDGPLLKKINKNLPNLNFFGNISRKKVKNFINNSKFIIIPSEWYESFPMTILEAFNENTLVLASNIGSIKSIIIHKKNGILFNPRDKIDLLDKINWIQRNSVKCNQITSRAKKEFNIKYSPEKNYFNLLKIYNEAIKSKKKN